MSRITQVHGWIHIRYYYESRDELDELEEEKRKQLCEFIEGYIEEHEFFYTDVHIFKTYGESYLTVCGFSWHYAECQLILDLYQKIAEKARGAYGLLYVQEEERNAFRVYILKRGTLTEQEDTFLSPCIPEIEDYVS